MPRTGKRNRDITGDTACKARLINDARPLFVFFDGVHYFSKNGGGFAVAVHGAQKSAGGGREGSTMRLTAFLIMGTEI